MLEVYAVQVPGGISPPTYHKLLTCVSPDKRERISRFKRQEDALRTLFADLLIRSVLLDRYGVPNRRITFAYNPYGKPFLSFDPQCAFNVSHSGSWVVAVVGYGPLVGIDVEKIRPVTWEVARRYFAPEEYADLAAKEGLERLHYFYDLWTLKESFVKALGRGLSVPLDSFVIRQDELTGRFSVRQNHVAQPFFFRQYELEPDYRLSVCATSEQFSPAVRCCDVVALCRRMLNEQTE